MMKKNIKISQCPDFPFFGAKYPDATCIDGQLFDLDKCDENGLLYELGDYWPCPFCKTEAFIKQYAECRGIKYKDARVMVKSLKQKYQPITDTVTSEKINKSKTQTQCTTRQ